MGVVGWCSQQVGCALFIGSFLLVQLLHLPYPAAVIQHDLHCELQYGEGKACEYHAGICYMRCCLLGWVFLLVNRVFQARPWTTSPPPSPQLQLGERESSGEGIVSCCFGGKGCRDCTPLTGYCSRGASLPVIPVVHTARPPTLPPGPQNTLLSGQGMGMDMSWWRLSWEIPFYKT